MKAEYDSILLKRQALAYARKLQSIYPSSKVKVAKRMFFPGYEIRINAGQAYERIIRYHESAQDYIRIHSEETTA